MIIVHGGAGIVTADRIPYLRGGTRAAAMAGDQVLARGGSALDAVVAAVRLLEQDPEFGAATGSALTRDGTVETGASVMDGATRRAGAVAAVPDCAAPVILARRVLEMGEHVVLAGAAAQTLANEIGFPPAPAGSLITPRTQQQHAAAKAGQRTLEGGGVGCVVRDSKGNFAAATSTGGIVFRRAGSIDDSAIPGVGTWADDICAISTSGGESLFRVALAHNIAMRIHAGAGPRKAVEKALGDLRDLAKDQIAGAIVLDKNSWVALQIGPSAPIPATMPCGWVEPAGVNDAPGFPL